MNNNTFNDVFEKELLFESELNKYSIAIGIFDEDSNKEEEATLKNPDGTTSKINLAMGDIMYFIENGTIVLPENPILRNIIEICQPRLEQILDEIFTGVVENNWGANEIRAKLMAFVNEINSVYVHSGIEKTVREGNNINELLNKSNHENYLISLDKLKKYLKCKLIF